MLSQINSLAWASLLMAQLTTAHMTMQQPVPYSKDKLTKDPLSAGDFPCKQKNGFTVTQMNNMAVGETQTLKFDGSAVHGGGSCQLAVTLDKEPTVNSKFKVIKSIEGGCPGVDGGPSTFEYQIPKEIPNGEATFAWTWFSKLSGAPEMYMNCAPITVTGGASDSSGFDALPDMFVANIPERQCTSPQNFDTKFPSPGSAVQKSANANLKDPSGSACGAASGGDDSSSGSSSAAGGAATSAAASTPSPAASTPAPASSSSAAGGIFAPGASSAAASTPAASTATLTTLMTVTASSPAVLSSAAPPAATGGAGGSSSNGTSCSPDGAVICNGSSQFGLCNHGSVVFQDVASGTTCSNGVISRRHPVMRVMGHKRNPHSHHF